MNIKIESETDDLQRGMLKALELEPVSWIKLRDYVKEKFNETITMYSNVGIKYNTIPLIGADLDHLTSVKEQEREKRLQELREEAERKREMEKKKEIIIVLLLHKNV